MAFDALYHAFNTAELMHVWHTLPSTKLVPRFIGLWPFQAARLAMLTDYVCRMPVKYSLEFQGA